MTLDNSRPSSLLSSERLLGRLKARGGQTTAELADGLALGIEATRQLLARLAERGLVEARDSRSAGAGRPARRWYLTALAERRYPDAHGALAAGLIEVLREELGEAGLGRIVAAREAVTRTQTRAALAGIAPLAARGAALAALRTSGGYMAEWQEAGDGYLLIENHCPINAAARACDGFCRAELEIFRDVLGDEARVERVEHLQAGASRCAYRIDPHREKEI